MGEVPLSIKLLTQEVQVWADNRFQKSTLRMPDIVRSDVGQDRAVNELARLVQTVLASDKAT